MSSLVHSLEKYPFLSVVTDWLTVLDFANLDTAFCSTTSRELILRYINNIVFRGYKRECFDSTNFSFGQIPSFAMNNTAAISMMSWMKMRNIKVDHLLLTCLTCDHALENIQFDMLRSLCLTLWSYSNAVQIIPDETLAIIISKSPQVTELSIYNSGLVVSEQSLLNLIKHYESKLSTLTLGLTDGLSSNLVLSAVTKYQKKLTSLNLSGSKTISDAFIEVVCDNCVGLTTLDISQNARLTAKRSAVAIVNKLVNLRNISFDQQSTKSNAEMFLILRRRFSVITCLDLLRHFASGVPLSNVLMVVWDDVIRDVLEPKPFSVGSDMLDLNDKIYFVPACSTSLKVASMPRYVFGHVLDTFLWKCGVFLQVLDLQSVEDTELRPLDPHNDLCDSSLFVIAARCDMLRVVNFSYRECITDEGMVALVTKNVNLVEVICVGCSNVGPETIIAISKYCHELEVLNVSESGGAPDLCLISLASGCSQLVHLGIKKLSFGITSLSIDNLVLKCKRLQNIQRSAPALSYSALKGFYERSTEYVPQLETRTH
jgi:hypothetical protein